MGRRLAVEWWANLLNDGWPVTLAGEFLLTFADDGQCREVREYWPLALHVLRPPMSGVCRLWLRRGQAPLPPRRIAQSVRVRDTRRSQFSTRR